MNLKRLIVPGAATEAGAPVPSPCSSVCRMDEATGWCLGCARTLPEIAAWAGLEEADKRRVWSMLPARVEALGERYQGRGAPRSG